MKSSKRKTKAGNSGNTNKQSFRVVRGQKQRVRRSGFIFIIASVAVLCVYLIILAIHPIGVIEYFSSIYKTVGSGKGYDITLNGEDIISVNREDNIYYLLSSNDIACYNNNGKIISKVNHGFSKPIAKISETRCLVYGQGEKAVKVFKYNQEALNIKSDFSVLSADISNNGNFAVASYADSYDSVVRVYNKNGEQIYEWYSADGIVNAVLLNDQGNRIIVSSFTVNNGIINSTVRVLSFNSADSLQSFSFNDIAYEMHNISNNRILAIFENNIYTLNIKDGTYAENKSDYSYNIFDSVNGYTVLSSSLSANSEKNVVELFDKKGSKINSFEIDYSIKDLALYGKTVFILTESKILTANFDGNILSETDVGFDVKRIVPIASKQAAAISNNYIFKK